MAFINVTQPRSATQAKLQGAFGKLLTSVGTKFKAPQIRPGGLGAQLQTNAGYYLDQLKRKNPFNPPPTRADNTTPTYTYDDAFSPVMASYPTGDVLGTSSTSGGTGGTTGTTYPDSGTTDLNLVDASWDEARKAIEASNPILDETYALGKGDIERGIASTEQAGEKQIGGLGKRYGDILGSQLRTYQDLGRQRQGIFSSLGTLESSAFGEQQARADQSLGEGRLATEQNRESDIKSVQDQVNEYTNSARSELSRLALKYQEGKNAITAALASNDIQAAAAIKDTIDQIRTRAMTIASLLPGTLSSIGGVTGENYANSVQKQLASLTSSGNALYTPSSTPTEGEGFIAPNGKRYRNYQEYLQSFA